MRVARTRRVVCPVDPMSIDDVDATQLVDDVPLWQGGLGELDPCGVVAFHDIDRVIIAADDLMVQVAEPRPVYVPLSDTGHRNKDMKYVRRARAVAKSAADALRRGKSVAVFCRQGRNRSGLVNALILWDLFPISGQDAMDIIRGCRFNALDNEHFEAYLSNLGPMRRLRRKN